jgi:uncharacterized membrane protein YidH (DUF202 family)
VRNKLTISHRGASYEIGRGPGFYGIWPLGGDRTEPLGRWPETPAGWYEAWSRFMTLERPDAIAPVTKQATAPLVDATRRRVIAASLLGAGVVCGVIGLFPTYLDGASLAQQNYELVPHAIYLAVWTVSALLIVLGGNRARMGALLAAGMSIVSFGFFFADAGGAISYGAHIMGAGLVVSLLGWLACTLGTAVAFGIKPAEGLKSTSPRFSLVPLVLTSLCALGVAIAFAPSWDSYRLHTAAGLTRSLVEGNVFSNPGPVIAGNFAVMVAIVAVAALAALWRPARGGAVLLGGAIIPMVGQAISAILQLGGSSSPSTFGISSAAAERAGLTIHAGLTAAFWLYCAFLLMLAITGTLGRS